MAAATRKIIVAGIAMLATREEDTKDPRKPPLSGKARLMSPNPDRRKMPMLPICSAPNLRSNDWNKRMASRMNERGKSKYPTPRTE